MPYGTVNADLMTTSDGVSSSGLYGFKNRIINGAMVIDQRNAGASVSVGTATATYTLDRWRLYHDTAITSNITAQQSATVPTTGYINSQILTNGTGASPASVDLNTLQQRIEGYNVADLNFGASTASSITLSFWVRSSLTGTFGVGLSNSAQDRSVASTYTINSANTWEQKTITLSGDQSGTWVTNNGIGLIVNFDLGSGTTSNATTAGTWQAGRVLRTSACTNFIGTTGATFYITGVQLEKGSTATSFDYRPYGTELFLCQRYFWRRTGASNATFGVGQVYNTTDIRALLYNPVVMRTAPSITFTGSNFSYANSGSIKTLATLNAADQTPEVSLLYSGAGTTASTQGQAAFWLITSSASYIDVSAEL